MIKIISNRINDKKVNTMFKKLAKKKARKMVNFGIPFWYHILFGLSIIFNILIIFYILKGGYYE
jgi:hypothetical protein